MGFHVVEIPKVGRLDRLLGRVPREAAFIEIRNMLATTPWHELFESAVATILARHKMTCRDEFNELRAIYHEAVTFAVADHTITAEEREGLNRLKIAFDFEDADANAVLREVGRDLYREMLVDALADGNVTPDERASLDRIASNLQLTPDVAELIYAEEAPKAIELYFNHAISDGRYSPDEERRLQEMGEALGVVVKFDEKTTALINRLRQLGRIDAGELPTVNVPLMLTRGEVCHFTAEGIAQKELRTMTKRINYSGPTASLRIMKGVRWRVGSIAPQRITQDVLTEVNRGAIFITSKKLLIQDVRKNTSVPLAKVTHFTVYSDGLQIQKETGRDIYLLGDADWQLAGACLDAAARHVR